MAAYRRLPAKSRRLFIAVAALQIVCGAAFLVDGLSELESDFWHAVAELVVVAALWTGGTMTLLGMRRLMDRNAVVEEQLDTATGAFHSVLEERFDAWGLTPSERDVALLAVKGLSVHEIAAYRNTREGTIRAQQAAIYRKASVSGRPELLSHFIEEIAAGLPGPTRA